MSKRFYVDATFTVEAKDEAEAVLLLAGYLHNAHALVENTYATGDNDITYGDVIDQEHYIDEPEEVDMGEDGVKECWALDGRTGQHPTPTCLVCGEVK